MVIGRKDLPLTLWLLMISDENENQFSNFDISDSLLSNYMLHKITQI